jgi:hypothetical protein
MIHRSPNVAGATPVPKHVSLGRPTAGLKASLLDLASRMIIVWPFGGVKRATTRWFQSSNTTFEQNAEVQQRFRIA